MLANEDDAGNKPECNNYGIAWPEIYFGRCNSGTTSIVSGFRFQNVSLPPSQSILASYIEFTVDGPYGPNTITANIYGKAALSPNSFTGNSPGDITARPTVQPTATWNIRSTNETFGMGDQWELGYTRRTSDVTSILAAIMGQSGWQSNNPVVFLFKNMTSSPTSSRRVIAKDRLSIPALPPTRLVVRTGQVPQPSVSYYWQSTLVSNSVNILNPLILEIKARKEAQRNRPVLVILDLGATKYSGSFVGTKLVSTTTLVSTSAILDGAKIYIQEFVENAGVSSHLLLGVGTNNTGDMMCTTTIAADHGQAWALMMNDLQTWITQQGYDAIVQVSGANDFESWAGKRLKCTIGGNQSRDPSPPQNALAWAESYAANTDALLINYGAVDGTAIGSGNSEWGADVYWQLSWGIPEAYPMPEIYNTLGSSANQWQELARISAICTNCLPEQKAADPNWTKGRTMQFLGSLTNQGELSKSTLCSTSGNSPSQGWLQLYRRLVVDVYTDSNYPQYSSDITYEDQEDQFGQPTSPAQSHETADTCALP